MTKSDIPSRPPVSEVPLRAADERRRMLVDWNATATPYAADQGVHHMIARSAAERPHAIALACRGETLSYGELDRRANRIARHLRDLGVGRDTPVGLSLERSIDLVVAALAILKAGGAYVPMDPAYPRDRRGFMVEDSGARVIVTASHLLEDLPDHDACLVFIDTDRDEIARHDDSPLDDEDFSPDQLAYVIFTSGSTGRPKGVMVEHRNVSNFFTAMDGVISPEGRSAPGVWLAVTSLSFDISVLELFWTLARGFKVVIHVEADDPGDDGPGSIPALIAAHAGTLLQCVPALARVLS